MSCKGNERNITVYETAFAKQGCKDFFMRCQIQLKF